MYEKLVNQFLIKWTLITSLGWLIAQAVALLITAAAFPNAELEAITTSPLYWAVFGIFFGLSQWISLRNHISPSFAWVVATAIGMFVAALILKFLNRSEVINAFLRESSFLVHLFGGLLIGLAQYQAIKKIFPGAAWWMIIVSLSWAFSQVLIGFHNTWIQLLGVFFFTITTGLGITWLAQNLASETQAA